MIQSIAVLITCHNRKTKTLACLDALYKCKVPEGYEYSIFLVDDGSTDGTSDAVIVSFPEVHIIQGTGNLYWNRGMYLAWKTASDTFDYDLYLWLNDDTFLYEDALIHLLSATKNFNSKAIIVGTTFTNNKIISYGGFDLRRRIIEPNGELQECDFFNGNCVLIPKHVFSKVGNLDYRFHHSLGDIDYGIRAGKINIKRYVIGQVIGACELHENSPKWLDKNELLISRLKALYSPLGCNPFQFFVFDYRQNNILVAIKHFISIHYKAIFP